MFIILFSYVLIENFEKLFFKTSLVDVILYISINAYNYAHVHNCFFYFIFSIYLFILKIFFTGYSGLLD